MRRAAVLIAVLAIAVTACGSDESADPVATASSTADSVAPTTAVSTTAAPTTAPTTAPPTTVAPTTVPPTTAAPTTSPATTAAPTTAAPTTAPPTTLPPFPPFLTDLPDPPDVWSVVLAASADFDDPVLTQAIADAAAAGYLVGITNCDEGAVEALGLVDEGQYTITVYLNSEADARAAAAAFAARGVDATVTIVRIFCLD